ncbi:hypothetical protein D3C87_1342240 [compost metagenome]
MRHVAHQFARGLGQQQRAGAHFLQRLGGLHRGHGVRALGRTRDTHAALVFGLEANHLVGNRVTHRQGRLEGLPVAADGCLAGANAARVAGIATAHVDAGIGQGHEPRRGIDGALVHHQRADQERLDVRRRNAQDRVAVSAFAPHARREAAIAACAARCGRAQVGAAIAGNQIQDLAGIDQVWIADLLLVHAPQLGPAPGLAQVAARDTPQGVARAHRVLARCAGRQIGNGNALLCRPVGLRLLRRRDTEVRGLDGHARPGSDAGDT